MVRADCWRFSSQRSGRRSAFKCASAVLIAEPSGDVLVCLLPALHPPSEIRSPGFQFLISWKSGTAGSGFRFPDFQKCSKMDTAPSSPTEPPIKIATATLISGERRAMVMEGVPANSTQSHLDVPLHPLDADYLGCPAVQPGCQNSPHCLQTDRVGRPFLAADTGTTKRPASRPWPPRPPNASTIGQSVTIHWLG